MEGRLAPGGFHCVESRGWGWSRPPVSRFLLEVHQMLRTSQGRPTAFSQLKGWGQLGSAMGGAGEDSLHQKNSPVSTTFLITYCHRQRSRPPSLSASRHHFAPTHHGIWISLSEEHYSILTFPLLLPLRLKQFNRDQIGTGQVWK